MNQGFIFESVASEISANYELYPILCNHYSLDSAFVQKVSALIHRSETQARDVFDLDHLLGRGAKQETLPSDLRSQLDQAIENTLSLSHGDYKSQVVAFLPGEYQAAYGTEEAWNQLQGRLIHLFEILKEKP